MYVDDDLDIFPCTIKTYFYITLLFCLLIVFNNIGIKRGILIIIMAIFT